MEILGRSLVTCFLLLSAMNVQAQSNAVLQKAFHSSYTDELNKNYTAAINDIMPYYMTDGYEINIRLGWLYYLNQNYNASQNYYQKAVALKPGSIEAKFGFIKPLSFLQSWDKVLDQYLAILKIDPQNTQASYWAGVIYYNRRQFEISIRYFRTVATLYPYDYDGNHMLAWSLLMAGKKVEAANYFEKSLLIKPGDESSMDGLNRSKL
jgi:tetratricopeptide (TPR) repeat protein